ncbi:toxin [Hydrogenophaga sp. ANAO-22]|uniref:toxin n=1 Tax=Hydrogenophaga sp. ANAO-22 TaxID=3166645 RepID=UPI0036D36A74
MRFLVVGTSGAGKSTFAEALGRAAQCPHIELDRFYWGPGWEAVPHAQFERAVLAATEGARWVADGNYSAVRDVLWPRATQVVWLNYSRWTVFSRLLWRTLGRIMTREELFQGNRESLRMSFFSRDSVLLWSYRTFETNRRKYAGLREDPRYAHLQWTEITRPSEARAFIERHTA